MESTPEYRASVAVWQYCPPVLFAFGTFGNVMTVVILRRMRIKRSAMPVYLTALALSDTCLLYTGLLRRWVLHVFLLDFRTVHPAACKVMYKQGRIKGEGGGGVTGVPEPPLPSSPGSQKKQKKQNMSSFQP